MAHVGCGYLYAALFNIRYRVVLSNLVMHE